MTTVKNLIDVFLQPGDWFVANGTHQIRTLLGSCVSVTLWHEPSRIGGMSHFLLPSRGGIAKNRPLDGRYCDEALQLILNKLAQSGITAAQCQGKIFGGGNMFARHAGASTINVGQRNGEAARSQMQQLGIPVISECLFGFGHRQIIFDVFRGDVWSCQVEPN